MIYVTLDDRLTAIMISCDTFEPSIQALSEYLKVLRKSIHEDQEDVIELETLEIVRYKLRKAMGYSNNLPFSNDQENKGIADISIVAAFFYARVLQRAMSLVPKDSVHDENRKALAMLIQTIDETLKEISKQEYEKIIDADQEQTSFLYIQYLNYLYEHFSMIIAAKEKQALFMLLCKQIMRIKEYDSQEKENLSVYRICEYPHFKQYCADWMEANYEDEICLEDIVADLGFAEKQ